MPLAYPYDQLLVHHPAGLIGNLAGLVLQLVSGDLK